MKSKMAWMVCVFLIFANKGVPSTICDQMESDVLAAIKSNGFKENTCEAIKSQEQICSEVFGEGSELWWICIQCLELWHDQTCSAHSCEDLSQEECIACRGNCRWHPHVCQNGLCLSLWGTPPIICPWKGTCSRLYSLTGPYSSGGTSHY